MASKKETVFRARIRPHLDALEHTVVISIQQKSIRGVPDLLLCCDGMFVALELKKDAKSHPSKLQYWWLERIADAGGISIVVYPENWEEVHAFLQAVASGIDPNLLIETQNTKSTVNH